MRDSVDILWLPATSFRFGLLAYNIWHAHPDSPSIARFSKNEPICVMDASGMARGRVWNQPKGPLITSVCKKCKRQMDMWDMAE